MCRKVVIALSTKQILYGASIVSGNDANLQTMKLVLYVIEAFVLTVSTFGLLFSFALSCSQAFTHWCTYGTIARRQWQDAFMKRNGVVCGQFFFFCLDDVLDFEFHLGRLH